MCASRPWPLLMLALLGAKPALTEAPEMVAWSADSQRVVLGGRKSGTLVLDRRGKGQLLEEKLLSQATLSPDGRWVVAARESDFVAVDPVGGAAEPVPVPGKGGRPVQYLRTANGDVMVLRQSANHEIHRFGGPLATARTEPARNFVRLWADPRDPLLYVDTGFGLEIRHQWTGALLRSLDAQRKEQRVVDAVRTADGALVVALRDADGFRVWTPPDPPGGPWELPPEAPVALAGDGSFVAVGTSSGVELRSSASREVVQTFGTKDPVVSVSVSPDAGALAVVTASGSVRVFEVEVAGLRAPVDRPPDAADPGRISAEALRRPEPPQAPFDRTVAMPGATSHLTWAPGSGRLAGWVGSAWTELDPATGQVTTPKVPKLVPGSPYAWSEDGGTLAGVTETGVALVDARRWKVIRELPTGGRHQQLQWEGNVLVVDVGSGRAQAWDAMQGTPLAEPFSTSPDPIARFALAPGGEILVVRGKVPAVLRAANGQMVRPLAAQAGGVAAAAWSGDGRRLATLGNDGTLLVWDPATWTPLALVEGGHGVQLAFSPDGSRLASVGYDGAVVADAETGALLERLPFDGLLASVDWSTFGLELADNAGNVYVRSAR